VGCRLKIVSSHMKKSIGAVSETELLRGKYLFDELAGLSPAESEVLLDAAILRFLQHNICFRGARSHISDQHVK
jgi:hypothetical protein